MYTYLCSAGQNDYIVINSIVCQCLPYYIDHRSVKELLELKCFPTLLAGGVGESMTSGAYATHLGSPKSAPQGLTGLPTGPPLVDPVGYPALPISSMTRSAPQHR